MPMKNECRYALSAPTAKATAQYNATSQTFTVTFNDNPDRGGHYQPVRPMPPLPLVEQLSPANQRLARPPKSFGSATFRIEQDCYAGYGRVVLPPFRKFFRNNWIWFELTFQQV